MELAIMKSHGAMNKLMGAATKEMGEIDAGNNGSDKQALKDQKAIFFFLVLPRTKRTVAGASHDVPSRASDLHASAVHFVFPSWRTSGRVASESESG